ncbi:MAG: helix-turn-helix domain-containing protein [Mycobacteriales bacterium]
MSCPTSAPRRPETSQPLTRWPREDDVVGRPREDGSVAGHDARSRPVPPRVDADLACAPNRGTTPHPGSNSPALHGPTPPAPPANIECREPAKAWLTLADVAEALDVSTRTVVRWAERGQFPAVVLPGGRKRIHQAAFHTWLANLPLAHKDRPKEPAPPRHEPVGPRERFVAEEG